uniref:Uncharacterized protein n=1 Tax=Scylla paramamosain TaxID=85552 RepID=D2DT43_SCYPA|nr:hypothetical protein [Scylla paramamosain]
MRLCACRCHACLSPV